MWESEKIGLKIRKMFEDTEQMERNREDNLPDNDYLKNIEALVAGSGFMVFLLGLSMVVLGFGAVNRLGG